MPRSSPLVSVVLCVYNGEPYLRESIRSILDQTLTDLELLVIDDGSTDATPLIAQSFDDERLRLIRLRRSGLVSALRVGIQESQGRYVARMDADDVSRRRRLQLQVAALEADAGAVLAGCGYVLTDPQGRPLGVVIPPMRPEDMDRRLLVRNPYAGGSLLMRNDAFDLAGLPSAPIAVDYDLVLRFARCGRLVTVPDVLYEWRILPDSMSHERAGEQAVVADDLRANLWTVGPRVRGRAELRALQPDEVVDAKTARLLRAQHLRTELLIAAAMARRGSRVRAVRQLLAVIAAGPSAWTSVLSDLPVRLKNRFRTVIIGTRGSGRRDRRRYSP